MTRGSPIYKKYNTGTTGKYNDGIPEGSRFATHPEFFQSTVDGLGTEGGKAKIERVKQLTKLAQEELGCTVAQLALAWVARNPNTSTVILGATKPEQGKWDELEAARACADGIWFAVVENLKAIDVIPKLTPEVLEKIEKILNNKPKPAMRLLLPIQCAL